MKKNKTRLGFGRRIKQGIATLLATAGLAVGVNVATATPAAAVETTCPDWYHCAVTFNKEETKWMAEKGVPMNYPNGPALMAAVFMYMAHKPYLNVYASKGMCTKVTVSLAAWETQGFDGYHC